MAHKHKLACLACIAVLGAGLLTACNDEDPDDQSLTLPSMLEVQPGAEPPKIKFPAEWHQADPTVNAFIMRVLDICQRGDYDRFCSLFGISDAPPGYDDFKRIWGGVGELAVRSVRMGSDDPPQYFVHTTVKLRQADSQKRTERAAVIRVFKELDDWRISAAPQDIVRKVLIADSQPASSAPAVEPPVQPSGRTAAPPAQPAVYKTQSPGS